NGDYQFLSETQAVNVLDLVHFSNRLDRRTVTAGYSRQSISSLYPMMMETQTILWRDFSHCRQDLMRTSQRHSKFVPIWITRRYRTAQLRIQFEKSFNWNPGRFGNYVYIYLEVHLYFFKLERGSRFNFEAVTGRAPINENGSQN